LIAEEKRCHQKGTGFRDALCLSAEVVSVRTVIALGSQAAFLEICALSRTGKDQFFQASLAALSCRHGAF
jgi:hypothetical protein